MSYPVKDTDPTIGRLVSDASRDLSTLVSQEIALAKSEIRVSIKNGGTGVGLFAAAAFFGLMSLIMLSVAIAYLIHWNGQGLDLHWAFLIVFGFYLLLAAILGADRRAQGQEGQGSRAGDPPGAGDRGHAQARLTRTGTAQRSALSRRRHPSTRRCRSSRPLRRCRGAARRSGRSRSAGR